MFRLGQTLVAVLFTLTLVSLAGGQQSPPADLAGAARKAVSEFKPVTPDDVAAARKELTAAIGKLDTFLRTGAAAKRAGWRRYLEWDQLAALSSSESLQPTGLADTLIAKLTANNAGLDLPVFTTLRQKLQDYHDASMAAANPKLREEYVQRLDELANHLEAYGKDSNSGDHAIAIGQTVGWLARSRQAEPLRRAIRDAYDQPNVLGYMSKELMAAGVEDNVDRTKPVCDNILGTSLFGTGRMIGKTTLVLNENPSIGSYSVVLRGNVHSNNVGYNGPVTVHTTGITSVVAQKDAIMTPEGIKTKPARVSARTSSRINGISASRRLVQRIAWNRAGQQKGQAEAIRAAHAADRIRSEMDQESAKSLSEQDEKYQEKFRRPLLRRGGFPEDLVFSTTSQQMLARVMEAGVSQIGGPVAAPPHDSSHAMAVRAHESAVVNFGEFYLGGRKLTDEDHVRIIKEDLEAEVPEELKISPDKDPWSITYAKEVPFRAQFVGQKIKMSVRGTSFTRGDQQINDPLDISALYTVEIKDGGAKLTRQGDVEVTYIGRERLGATQVAFKTFIRRKFEAMFKPEFTSDGLQLKGRLAKVGKLRLTEMKADAAWLTLGWEMPVLQVAGVPK